MSNENGLAKVEMQQPQSRPGRSASKQVKGKAREAVNELIGSRDSAVAEVANAARAKASEKTAALKNELVEKLADELAQSEMQALNEVAGFLLKTIGNSQWLLSEASDILEGEIVEG